jgi:formylglycine-generating enzyme required for sulfatase activity
MLPSPLPDDPRKWDGWSRYDSDDYYLRLCLVQEARPSNELIEEHSRQLLVWWQKKLPLKNQPSNPIAQLLRAGIDAAPRYIAEARAELLNAERRAQIDAVLLERRRINALTEFQKFLDFALAEKVLTKEGENNLLRTGRNLGLSAADMEPTINEALQRTKSQREADLPPPPPPPQQEAPRTRRVRATHSPAEEFRRMLRLSGLDEDSMSDDRRDTFIDMAENLGLDPGEAEDMVDEYLEAVSSGEIEAVRPSSDAAPLPPPPKKTSSSAAPVVRSSPHGAAGASSKPTTPNIPPPVERLSPTEERQKHPDFVNTLGAKMLLIPSSTFLMGSASPDAPVNEQPQTRVTLSRYYLSRHPITNAQYEKFNPAHKSRRMPKANDGHPAVYLSSLEAIKFCQWLSARERKRYRLPTEAEWEYAAKGNDGRTYPWGETVGQGNLANFADANTSFAWSDPTVNDGYAETSPVGSYPLGSSPFGVEDMAGNVWEWCLDFYEPYKGTDRINPRGPANGSQRVYRGGSWKSRFANLKTTARGYNLPSYASNDVGFRIVCECE